MNHFSISSFQICQILFVPAWMAVLSSCGDDAPRQETILNLRGVGVEQSPVIAKPGSVVTLTFHLLDLQGKSITPTAYLDKASRYSTPTSVTLIDTAPTEQKLGSISEYVLRAKFTVPSDIATTALLAAKGSLRMRYGVAFNDGSRTENIIGDTLVYDANAPEQAWTVPTLTIDQPLTADISSTTSVSSTVKNTNDEGNHISWFVSSGKIKNRDGKSTEWSEVGTGEQTLIATTRGRKSGAFAIKTFKVNVH